MFRNSIKGLVLLICLSFSANLFAESVAVLLTDGEGVEKEKFDEELLKQLQEHPDFEMKERREIGIADLILGAGCSTPDEECMAQLADIVEADRLVFAKVNNDEKIASVRIYDFSDNAFVAEMNKVKFDDTDDIRLKIQDLLYGKIGQIFVDVSGSSAEVFLDGGSVGMAPATLKKLSLGKHTILVRSSDGVEKTKKVILQPGEPAQLSFGLEPVDSGEPSKIVKLLPGIGVLALGVGGIVFGAIQSSEIQGRQDRLDEVLKDEIFNDNVISEEEKDRLPPDFTAVHKENDASSAGTLQWVGYGVGIVGIGLGSYLLYSALGESAEVSISPNLSEPYASVKVKF